MASIKKTIGKRGANPSGEGSSMGQTYKRTRTPSPMAPGSHQQAMDDIIEEEEELAEKQQQQPLVGALMVHAPRDNPRKAS
jgi:hypothetical protein